LLLRGKEVNYSLEIEEVHGRFAGAGGFLGAATSIRISEGFKKQSL